MKQIMIFWYVPQGIAYISDMDAVPRWYKTSQISDQWYYYRDPG